jgi:hypothetical protein
LVTPITDVKALPFLKIGPPVELPGALRGFVSGALLDTGQREGQRQLYDLLVSNVGGNAERMRTEGQGYNVFKSVMEAGLTVRNPQIDMSADLLEIVFPRPSWPMLMKDASKLIYDTEQEVVIWFRALGSNLYRPSSVSALMCGAEYCFVRDTLCKRITYADIGSKELGEMRSVRGDMLVYYVNKVEVSESLFDEIGEAIADAI